MASAERWIGSRQRWSGSRARPSQLAPVAPGGGQARVGVVDVGRPLQLPAPGERAEDLLALVEHVAGPHPVALDAERHVGVQADREPGAGGIGGVAVLGDAPFGGDAPVVEDRFAGQLDLDFALDAEGYAHEQVLGVFVGRGPGVGGDDVDRRGGAQG